MKKRQREKGRSYGLIPFSLIAKTNVGKLFFKILKKHLAKAKPFSRIFIKKLSELTVVAQET